MSMTAKQLTASAFPSVVTNAKTVVLKEDASLVPTFRKTNDKKTNGAPKLVATAYSTHNSAGVQKPGKPTVYKLVVASNNANLKLHEAPLTVACTCDYFTFVCEVALQKKGAAIVKQSNGARPKITNPQLVPSPCKHLFKLLTLIQKRKV